MTSRSTYPAPADDPDSDERVGSITPNDAAQNVAVGHRRALVAPLDLFMEARNRGSHAQAVCRRRLWKRAHRRTHTTRVDRSHMFQTFHHAMVVVD